MRFSPVQSLALMAAALGFPSLSRTMPPLSLDPSRCPPPPESDDNAIGELVTLPPRDLNQERLDAAEERRRAKAEKKAANVAKAQAGRDPLRHLDHRTIGQ